jgi:predicted phosphodiesterase
MRYALISCIHSNLPALEAVLLDTEKSNCNTLVCLGDIVGYYDHPKECLDLVRSRFKFCVKGNHDDYCATTSPLGDFNPDAAERIEWTRGELSPVDRMWLSQLPYVMNIDDFTIVHACLDSPERWNYIFEKIAAARHFVHQSSSICFFGHTHVPTVFKLEKGIFHFKKETISGGTFSQIKIKTGIKYLVNVGSVGQPRDNNPDSSYVIYDSNEKTVELRRVSYPRPPSGGEGVSKPLKGGGPPGFLSTQARFP